MITRVLNSKIYFFFILLFSLLFASGVQAQTSVSDFDSLQAALTSTTTSVSVTQNSILFTGNPVALTGRSIVFNTSTPPAKFDGNSSFRGFSASNSSFLGFSNLSFENMKTPSLSNTSPVNNGGAISLTESSNASFTGRYSFTSNKAVSGGAVYAANSYMYFDGLATFTGNKATLYGGAVAAYATTINFNSGSFTDNSAANGGALYLGNTAGAYFQSNVSFSNNDASVNGGAFAAENTSSFKAYGSADISNNSAQEKGGGFYLASGSDAEFFNKTTIFFNSASMGGGFAADNNSVVLFNMSGSPVDISNNSALQNGGGFYSNNSAIVFDESFYLSGNVSGAKGGGFYAVNNSLILAYSLSVLSGNSATGDGGGFYAGSASGVSLGESSFLNNTSGGAGGGFAADSAEVLFDYSVKFISNTAAGSGGGFSAAGGSQTTFEQKAEFTGNVSGNGGAFNADSSDIIFRNDAEFTKNSSQLNGGGFNASDNASVSFFSAAAFTGNSALGYGGAVSLFYASTVSFYGNPTGSADVFDNNFAGLNGGAVYIEGASMYSKAAATVFKNNRAWQNGGAIYINGGSSLASFNGDTDFKSNSALTGGAVYVNSSDNFFLNGKNNSFTSNASKYAGGAMFIDNSKLSVNGKTVFTANSSMGQGGAGAIINGSSVNFTGKTEFTNNSASAGGALFIDSSDVTLNDASFTDNSAGYAGGAVYLQGTQSKNASLTVYAITAPVVFSGNTAAGKSNALHIGDYSSAVFKTMSGTSVEMRDGITSGNVDSFLTYSGAGDFNFYGDASSNRANIEINAQSGAAFNLKNGAKLNAGNLKNSASSVFNMINSQIDTVNVANFENDGTLNMEIKAAGQNDSILSSGNALLGVSSGLNIDSDFINDNFRTKTYKLIYYGGNLTGMFDAVTINPVLTYSLNYGDLIANWITLTLRGSQTGTDFSSLSGLSFNQKQTAKTFDKLAPVSSGDVDSVITLIESFDDNGQKKALAQSSGYFLANLIRSAAADSESKELYDRIKNHCSFGQLSGGLWAQMRLNYAVNLEDDNSPRDYHDSAAGIMAGYDRYDNGKVIGFYGKYNSHDISQDPNNKAELSNAGAGIYGGLTTSAWELKGTLSGSFDSYSADRNIAFLSRSAKSEFNGFTFGADMEGALKYKLSYNFELKPFLGIEAKNSNYESFDESKAGSMNQEVESGSYLRTAARAGAGATYTKNRFDAYLSGEAKYLLTGEYPQIESSFEKSGVSFKSRGAHEGKLSMGISAGAAVRIIEPVKVFANTNYFGAEHYNNFYINCGVRYNFCNLKIRKKEKPNTDYDGFNYAPPPELADYSPLKNRNAQAAATASENKLSDDFFNALVDGIAKNEMSDDMKTALSEGNRKTTPPISIELIKMNSTEENNAAKQKTYTLSMSNFITNKAELTGKAKIYTALIAHEILRTDYSVIKIEGHTDSTGSSAINETLSKERAKAVYTIFTEAGIPKEKISYYGMSSAKPIDSNDTALGRAKNRRVEIIIE